MKSSYNLDLTKFIRPSSIDSLEFRDITFSYGEHSRPVFADLSFNFPVNGVSNFCAADGSGKSTLMSLFALLSNSQSGQYLINNRDVSSLSFEEQLRYKWNIGYCFENEGLLNNQSLEGNLLLPLKYHKVFSEQEINHTVAHYLELFEIQKSKDERPANVSFRIRKLTALIRSWIHFPELLIIDEPTMGLSDKQVDLVFKILQNLIETKKLKHLYISSNDKNFCQRFNLTEIYIQHGHLYTDESLKKAMGI